MSESGAGLGAKGIVGLVLRGAVIAFSVGAIVAAAVAVGSLNDFVGSTSGGGDLATDTRGAAGWIIFVALAAIVVMALFIVLGIVSRENTVIQAVGIVLSILLGLGYFAGGVAAAKFSSDYDPPLGSLPSDLERVMASLAAAAALCFFSDVLLLILVILSVVLLVTKK